MVNLEKGIKILLLVFIALLGSQHTAFAEQMNNSVKDCIKHPEKCKDTVTPVKSDGEQKAKAQEVGVTFWDFVRMIFATAFVVALLYFLLRFINKKSRVYKNSQLVENLGGTSLGANRSVQIIKVANQLFIVGVGESIQLLKEIENENERNQIIDDYNSRMEQLIQPSDIVTKIVERTRKLQSSNGNGESFSAVLKTQLDDITKGRKKIFDKLEKKESDKQ